MGIEDDISDLRSKISDLTSLFLSTLSDQQIATSDIGTEMMREIIAARAKTSAFRLRPQWSAPGETLFVVEGTHAGYGIHRDVPQSVVDYCAKLEALGLKIKIEKPEPPK